MVVDTFESQARLLYGLLVAGKTAKFADQALRRFFQGNTNHLEPYDYLKHLVETEQLEPALRTARTGAYTRLKAAFTKIAADRPNMTKVTPEDLEKIPGIGPKTSRFVIVWVRPQETYAVLDTHVLKWLNYLGYNVPHSTPPKNKYGPIEQVFLQEAKTRGLRPRVLDALIWDHCAKVGGPWPDYLGPIPKPVPQEILALFPEENSEK